MTLPGKTGAAMIPKRKITYIGLLFLAWLVFALIALMPTAVSKTEAAPAEAIKPSPEQLALQERREVWLNALEWCESRGVRTAINQVDRDGTPSYGSFQFKPSTFSHYVEKYGIVVPPGEDFMHYESQKAIVRRMMDDPAVRWYNEFPDCTQNKIGLPPK